AADRRQGRPVHLRHRHRRWRYGGRLKLLATARTDFVQPPTPTWHDREPSVVAPRNPSTAEERPYAETSPPPRAPLYPSHSNSPYPMPDEEAVRLICGLAEHEGLWMGGSTGINIAGAIRLAKDMGPGATIVTILADYGARCQSKLFSPGFLREKGLPVPEWLERRTNVQMPYERA